MYCNRQLLHSWSTQPVVKTPDSFDTTSSSYLPGSAAVLVSFLSTGSESVKHHRNINCTTLTHTRNASYQDTSHVIHYISVLRLWNTVLVIIADSQDKKHHNIPHLTTYFNQNYNLWSNNKLFNTLTTQWYIYIYQQLVHVGSLLVHIYIATLNTRWLCIRTYIQQPLVHVDCLLVHIYSNT